MNSIKSNNTTLSSCEANKILPLPVKVVSVLFPFMGLYIQYDFLFETVGLTLAIFITLYCLITSSKIYLNKFFLQFSCFYIVRIGINFVLPSGTFSRAYIMQYLIIIAVALSVLVLSNFINRDLMYRTWKIIGCFIIVAVIIQYIQLNFFGQSVHMIKLWPTTSDYFIWSQTVERPVAFFTEPAMLAIYMAPLLHMALIRKEYLFAGIVSLSILLSASTVGMGIVVFLWAYEIAFMKNVKVYKRILIIIAVIGVALLLTMTSLLTASINKLMSELNQTNGTNAYIRTMMGYDVFKQLSTPEKILGIADQNTRSFMSSGRINLDINLSENIYGYFNTAQMVLITTGILGAALYLKMYFALFKYSSHDMRCFLLLQFVLMFGTKNFFGALYIIPFIYILSFKESKQKYIVLKI